MVGEESGASCEEPAFARCGRQAWRTKAAIHRRRIETNVWRLRKRLRQAESRDTHHEPAEGQLAQYSRKWTGQDLSDFISISVYTGLRISDVATFRADRL